MGAASEIVSHGYPIVTRIALSASGRHRILLQQERRRTTDLVVSHASALDYWSRHDGRLPDCCRERFPEAMVKPPLLSGGIQAELSELGLELSEDNPLDLLFWWNGLRSDSARVRAHAISRPIPPGALIRVSDHVLVSSPELTFIQMSHVYGLERLMMVGCELCGTYRLFASDGRPLVKPEERRRLTSTTGIAGTLALMGLGAKSVAGRALNYVFDDARSPMEAKVALLLSLPPRLGGFGLPRPVLNAPFRLSRSAYVLYPCSPCRLDLYWETARLDIEYDGEESHGPEAHAKDVARAAALALDDVEVLVLAKQQVYDRRAFALLAEKLIGRLGQRQRKRPDDFISRQMRLRHELDLA